MTDIPTNLNEAVASLRETIPEDELKMFASWEREKAANEAHHTVGRWIRNEWKLWVEGSPLREWFEKEIHAQHPDDMSSLILDALWNDLNEQPRRTVELLAEYAKHWEQFGT